MDDLLERPPPLGENPLRALRVGILGGMADEGNADRDDAVRYVQKLAQDLLLVRVPDERGDEALVDRGQEH